MITRRRDVCDKQVWGERDKEKTLWDVGFSYYETSFDIPLKTVREFGSIQLKMSKIVKGYTGSEKGRLGENASGRREAVQK